MSLKISKVTTEEKKRDKNCGGFLPQTIRQLLPPESLLSAIGNTNFVSRSDENTANTSPCLLFYICFIFFLIFSNVESFSEDRFSQFLVISIIHVFSLLKEDTNFVCRSNEKA